MSYLRRTFVVLFFFFLFPLSIAAGLGPWADAQATEQGQGRRMVVVEGTDYFGRDFETLKEVDLDVCESACLTEPRCKAFTYNLSARWCFLKSDYGELRAFPGAVSGYVAAADEASEDLRVRRISELGFLPKRYVDRARSQEAEIAALPLPAERSIDRLVSDARAAAEAGKLQRASVLYESALRLAPGSMAIWLSLAKTKLAIKPETWQARKRLQETGSAAAVNGYLRAVNDLERSRSLAVLGHALVAQSVWRPAIRAYRASLVFMEDATLRAAYDKLVSEHGFRIVEHRVDSDAQHPRICIELSDPLPRERAGLADYVHIDQGRNLAVEVEPQQLCVDGVRHGERYRIRVRAGLPAADGETLAKTADLDVYVRDRSPSVRFLGRAYVLPKGGEAAIPLVSVNSGLIAAKLYRIGDRAVVDTIGDGTFLKQLSQYESNELRDRTGEALWAGEIEVAANLNREVTTAVPIGALIQELKAGAYVMTAKATEATDSETLATQWFVVSDLGLAAYSGNDGLHALVRSLSSAGPLGEVRMRLVARNDEILGRAVSDAAGYARFEPGLLRGSGGNQPALLVAEGPEGDYAFLDLAKSPFDLSDRGVEGRAAPKPVDVFLVTERGVYRPDETVHITVLARDAKAQALTELPLTLIVKRPDGVEHSRELLADQGLGGRHLALELLPTAMRGTWRAAIHSDPKAPALAERPFLVEDFQPERLTFELTTDARTIDPADPPDIRLDARFLYGAPAAGLEVEGDLLLEPTDRLAAHAGYRFGLADETAEPVSKLLPGAVTDEAGQVHLALELPDLPRISRPLTSRITVRVLDGGGRPVERSHSMPVMDGQSRIGLKPLFDGSVDEGGNAAFEVIALGADGARNARSGLRWTLSKVRTSFQWYELDGSWDYEPITSRERVASGSLDVGIDAPARIEAPVEWGGYELMVAAEDSGPVPVSIGFDAGWYVAPTAVDTPDLLKVSLDKATYRIGETARVHIEPRFGGVALVMVMDDRLVSMTAARVPEDGATVELPVTADWGPGAYVTAALYRPMDLAAKRMPARAIGLAWAGVDPAERLLDLRLHTGKSADPRAPMELDLSLGNLAPGEEAYVTLAAVDVGILNLTRYQAPAPDDWYFGQRRLGMEIRDLYGQLIDRMQGVSGVIRSGGDASLMELAGPPPTEELVAFHSGILRVDDSGFAQAAFQIPDFNGTVRVMAMAWSANGVGHAVQDVLVRDPVVVQASLPRFLAPGDASRVLLELTHVEGPAGRVVLALEADGDGIGLDPDAARVEFDLDENGRTQVSVPLRGVTVGDHQLSVHLTAPDGRLLTKRLTVAVRSNRPPITRTTVSALEPGAAGLALSADLLTDLEPGTGSVLVSATGAGRLDVPGLLQALDRYPYGCAEQTTSRALPLLYLDDVALAAGLAGEPEAGPRIRQAIADLLGKQASGGGFGLWGPGDGDLWLDAYVTDFLTRAREQGYLVPEVAFTMALDNLRNTMSYASDFESGGEDLAYALYVLARNARAVIGDLRYYAETKLNAFSTALAKAQLGAALALYGDRPRADMAFRAALAHMDGARDTDGWRDDYGSDLRDAATVLVLAAESGTHAIDNQALATRIASLRGSGDLTSTQEDAWLLLAAHALMEGAARPNLAVDGEVVNGPLMRRFAAEAITAMPVIVVNRGAKPVDTLITVSGVPVEPPPAGGNGYRIERAYYDLDGRRVALERVAQGERLVVVLTVQTERKRAARLIVDDPLPAGFEIDNPNLIRAGELKGVPWLGLLETARHQEFRSDRFVAAINRRTDHETQFQLAYRIRAVSPGRFAHPAAVVEDMYRPQLRAWTGEGTVEVLSPVP